MELFFPQVLWWTESDRKTELRNCVLSEKNSLPLSKGLPAMKPLHSCCHIGESIFCIPLSRVHPGSVILIIFGS